MFQHILVPLDGSPRAEQAVPVAARIARFTGGSLLLVQVVNSPLDYAGGMATAPMVSQQIIDDWINDATTYLQALANAPQLAGINIRIEVLFGLPVQHLLALTEKTDIDLIVLCSHGRTGFTRWVLGSVAHVLVHQCTLPLLILRQDETASSLALIDATDPLRTLVPLDGSSRAEVALQPAAYVTAALAGTQHGALHLSQVVKSFLVATEEGMVRRLNEETFEDARTYLSQTEERLSPEAKELELELTHSIEFAPDVASALLALAEQGQVGKLREDIEEHNVCDLIAISTHGRGGLERWVMGSVTERLMNTTKLPMLIVRPPKEAS